MLDRVLLHLILCVILNLIQMSYEDRITIQTDLRKWSKGNDCKALTYANNMWKVHDCVTQWCKLVTEEIPTKRVNEITVDLRLAFLKYGNYLTVKFKRKTYSNEYSNEVITLQKSSAYKNNLNMENYVSLTIELHINKSFCGEIKNLFISYKKCTESATSLATFPPHYAPASNAKELYIKGSCIANGTPAKNKLYKVCFPSGDVESFDECVCSPGFYLHQARCIKCGVGTYKTHQGNEACKPCGLDSYNNAVNTMCLCREGSFRLKDQVNDYTTTCFNAKPRQFQVVSISALSAHIKWKKHQLALQTGELIAYKLKCKNCFFGEGNFPISTAQTHAEIVNLKPAKIYYVSISAEHRSANGEIISGKSLKVQFTTLKETRLDKYILIIIGATVAFIFVSCIVILCLFVNQKRTASSFMQRINSLKRSRRPPRPPSATESVTSEIHPYAVYKPAVVTVKQIDNQTKTEIGFHNTMAMNNSSTMENSTSGYVSMSSVPVPVPNKFNNHYVGTPKIVVNTPKLFPHSVTQHNGKTPVGISTKQQGDPSNKEEALLTDEITFSYIEKQRLFSRETYSRKRASTVLNPDAYCTDSLYINDWNVSDIYDNRISGAIQEHLQTDDFKPRCDATMQPPVKEFRSRNRSATVLTSEIGRSEKTESCYVPQGFSYIKIDESKLDKNYRRAESKNNLNAIVIPRRPHSADDVNRINSFV